MHDIEQIAAEKHVVIGNVTGQGRVIVTPLSSALPLLLNSITCSGSTVPVTPQQTRQPNLVVISRILSKAVPLKGVGKEENTFTLHNVDTSTIHDCEELKKLIKDFTTENFDVGYLDGLYTNVVRIQTMDDMFEVWSKIHNHSTVTLRCDGLFQSRVNLSM